VADSKRPPLTSNDFAQKKVLFLHEF